MRKLKDSYRLFTNLPIKALLCLILFFRQSCTATDQNLSKIAMIENLINISSASLLEISSQLSEAEEQEQVLANHGWWSKLRSMSDAKNLLKYLFNIAIDARSLFFIFPFFIAFSSASQFDVYNRCQLKERKREREEHKEQVKKLMGIFQMCEARRKDAVRQLKLREQALSFVSTTTEDIVCNLFAHLPPPTSLSFLMQSMFELSSSY